MYGISQSLKKRMFNLKSFLDPHTLEVLKKSVSSMLVKIAGMVVGLIISIFIGRMLGPEGLGIINLSNKIAELLIVLTMFGFNNVIIKNVAIAHNNDNKKIASTIYTATIFNGILAFIVAGIGYYSASFLSVNVFNEPSLKIPLTLAILAIVPQTYSRIFASGLNGFGKIWQSNLVNEALSAWVVGLGILCLIFFKIEITLINVALLYAIGRFIVFSSITFYWKSIFKYKVKKEFLLKPMIKMAFPLLLVAGTSIIASNSDVLMLGWLSNSKEVGIYTVAARLALLVSLFLQISNSAISPKLASMYANKNLNEMKVLVNRVTTGLLIIAIVFLAVFVFSGEFMLSLWGDEFKEAYWVLVILAVGQFFNISTGCAGMLLIMCGYEKIHGYISVISVTLNLIFNFVLISNYGAIGAAIATAITIVFENISKLILVKHKIGILTIPRL